MEASLTRRRNAGTERKVEARAELEGQRRGTADGRARRRRSTLSRLARLALSCAAAALLCAWVDHNQRVAWYELTARVERHIAQVHDELQQTFASVCAPDDPSIRVPSPQEQRRGDVNVPSCARMREAGPHFEEYYANLNMLLSEAWVGKVLPTLRGLSTAGVFGRPLAELVRVEADGLLAGAIFVLQLSAADAWQPAALMPPARAELAIFSWPRAPSLLTRR